MSRLVIALSGSEQQSTESENLQYHKAMALMVTRLFHARTVTHLMHLSTRSFAAHKALNEFYDGVLDLADSLAEAFQGSYGIISNYSFSECGTAIDLESPIEFLAQLSGFISNSRFQLRAGDTHLQNIIDEIVTLIDSTTYKLKFLN